MATVFFKPPPAARIALPAVGTTYTAAITCSRRFHRFEQPACLHASGRTRIDIDYASVWHAVQNLAFEHTS